MQTVVQCPTCRKTYSLSGSPPATYLCSRCGTTMDLSAFASSARPSVRRSGRGSASTGARTHSRRRARSSTRGGGFPWALGLLGLAGIVVAVVLITRGEERVPTGPPRETKTPRERTAPTAASRGPSPAAPEREWDARIETLRRAVRARPEDADAHFDLAEALEEQGRVEEAIVEYRHAVRLEPEDTHARIVLALALDDLGRHEEAILEYREVVRLEPQDVMAHKFLGLALDDVGRHEEALLEHQHALRLDADDPEIHAFLAMCLDELGRYDEAIAEFRHAIRLDPRDALAHECFGITFSNAGRHEEAIDEYRHATRLDPARVNSYLLECESLVALRRWDEAEKAALQGLERAPGDPDLSRLLASVREARGR